MINQRKTVGFLLLVFDDDVTTQNKKFGNERRKKKKQVKNEIEKSRSDQIVQKSFLFVLNQTTFVQLWFKWHLQHTNYQQI